MLPQAAGARMGSRWALAHAQDVNYERAFLDLYPVEAGAVQSRRASAQAQLASRSARREAIR